MSNSNHAPKNISQQYEVNTVYGSNTSPVPTKAPNHPQSGSGLPPTTGKRARKSDENNVTAGHVNTAEDDGRKKRSRGRPRLDTKDETAADRRRTQIRLAQRAYRHRKDTTITTLEQRVKELEKANDDMSRGFNDFYDLLVSERVLDAVPHTIQRLSTIANRITTVADKARNSTGEVSCSEESDESPTSRHENHPNLYSVHSVTPALAAVSPNNGFHLDASQQGHVLGTSDGTPGAPGTAAATSSGPMIHVPASLGYEVVTAATPDNASFPFYSSMEPTIEGGFNRDLTAAHPPYSTIPPPASYALNELTFGRRLQRQTTENGLRLILMSNPPPERFAAVFGFCLFFESKDAIIKRLQATLSRRQHEDLCNWRAPFTGLGGAGTFFPPQQSIEGTDGAPAGMPIGNQGTRSYGKLQDMTGQSMGPFGPELQAIRDERLDDRLRMMLPGFEGEFFDPDEVEAYLRQLGIFIPQRAEYVEADIDIADLDCDGSSTRASSDSTVMANGQQPGFANPDSGYGGSNHSGMWTSNSNSPVSATTDAPGPQAAVDMSRQQHVMGLPVHQRGTEQAGDYEHGMVNFMLSSEANGMWQQPVGWAVKSKIGLNVSMLIQEISSKSVCLGRAPGVRRKDVNMAVKIAAGAVLDSSRDWQLVFYCLCGQRKLTHMPSRGFASFEFRLPNLDNFRCTTPVETAIAIGATKIAIGATAPPRFQTYTLRCHTPLYIFTYNALATQRLSRK
ncbi:bZIP family transcription factor [Metarhizium album ARSEF 1941]|uniref:BZIP family transcription factor n=1 Tax=Metarhizium album (strain ARSEF 1941) TaxID=1081103 RepID=A0A0B2WIS9_METAS|nr:bZIP family transcription factor [Metarhizium album ARSEF 1941]KHN95951.1 bZIP family transcription factor [Metarhizium album ARSEF 1941]